MKERVKKVNIENLTNEQLQEVISHMSAKILKEFEETKKSVDKSLSTYGLKCEVHLKILPIKQEEETVEVEDL